MAAQSRAFRMARPMREGVGGQGQRGGEIAEIREWTNRWIDSRRGKRGFGLHEGSSEVNFEKVGKQRARR